LDQWAKAHGIPKSTLYSRVVERGMTMADALKLGSRNEAAAASELPSQSSDSDHCRTFAADKTNRDGLIGQNLSEAEAAPSKKTPRKAGFEGAQGRNRTADTRIFKPAPGIARGPRKQEVQRICIRLPCSGRDSQGLPGQGKTRWTATMILDLGRMAMFWRSGFSSQGGASPPATVDAGRV
jgi:hypothetical protein